MQGFCPMKGGFNLKQTPDGLIWIYSILQSLYEDNWSKF